VKLEVLDNEIAIRVTGVDLSRPMPEATWRTLSAAWERHHALIFSGQEGLSDAAHVAFLSRFGPVLEEREPGQQHSYVTNTVGEGKGLDDIYDGYREGELTPHMDYTYTRFPADVISLYAAAVPDDGTQTRFYSNVIPLRRMPAEFVAELRGYSIRCVLDLANLKEDIVRYLEPRTADTPQLQRQNWPLVRQHPNKADRAHSRAIGPGLAFRRRRGCEPRPARAPLRRLPLRGRERVRTRMARG
jgi:alpha-ketoglutarate-dependent taurine dioxygenase